MKILSAFDVSLWVACILTWCLWIAWWDWRCSQTVFWPLEAKHHRNGCCFSKPLIIIPQNQCSAVVRPYTAVKTYKNENKNFYSVNSSCSLWLQKDSDGSALFSARLICHESQTTSQAGYRSLKHSTLWPFSDYAIIVWTLPDLKRLGWKRAWMNLESFFYLFFLPP